MPNARVSPRYSGVCSFFRFPVVTQAKKLDWAVYGVPFDQGTTYRSGARFGPRSIREQSAYIKPYHLVYRQSLIERYSLADVGDCPISPFSLEETTRLHEEFSQSWRKSGAKTFAIGGDHSIAVGNMSATAKTLNQPMALIHFDSHTDTVDELWGEKYSHASPIRRGIEAGYFDKNSMISIGIKGPLNSEKDLEWGEKNGVQLVGYDEWRSQGDQRIRDFTNHLGNRPAYLTFDIDCIDPTYAPGTGTPSVGGFTSAEVIDLVRIFRGINLQGADLVEVSPSLDSANITSLLAAQIIFEILNL